MSDREYRAVPPVYERFDLDLDLVATEERSAGYIAGYAAGRGQARSARRARPGLQTDQPPLTAARMAEMLGLTPGDLAELELRRLRRMGPGGGRPTYQRGGPHSYIRDLVHASGRFGLSDVADAQTRLDRHQGEMRAVNRTDGQGGYFVPPVWFLADYQILAATDRVLPELIGSLPLPSGTDSINIPAAATGATVGIQDTDGAAATSTDLTDVKISAPVATISGYIDCALQMIEQSVPFIDEILFSALAADYEAQLSQQLINGSGINGQITGLLNVSGVNAVSFTSGSPTVQLLWPKLADAISRVHKNRRRLAQAALFLSDRWLWISQALGSTGGAPFAELNEDFTAGMRALSTGSPRDLQAGSVFYVPAFVETGIPTTLGGGGNEDRIVICRPDDLMLFESDFRLQDVQPFTDPLSGTLQARIRYRRYVAFACLQPKSVSVVSGTGLASTGITF